MMFRRLLGVGIALVAGASVSLGQVSVSYSPTTVPAGGTVQMTVTLADEGGAGLDIVGVLFDFAVPSGLTLSDFQWLSGFDNDGAFFHTEELPRPQTAASGSMSVPVPAGGQLGVCTFDVAADAGSAGMVLTLLVFPEGPNSGVIEDPDLFKELVITTGDSVAISVSGDGGGGGSGGGGGAGGGSGQGNANQNDNGSAGNANGNVNSNGNANANGNVNDNSGGSGNVNDNGLGGGNGNDNGSVGDGSDVNVDNDNGGVGNGNANDSSGGGGGGSGNVNGNDNGSGGGGGSDTGGGPAPTSFCGVGMIPFGLFTLLGLSVMKMHDTRRRQRSVLN